MSYDESGRLTELEAAYGDLFEATEFLRRELDECSPGERDEIEDALNEACVQLAEWDLKYGAELTVLDNERVRALWGGE